MKMGTAKNNLMFAMTLPLARVMLFGVIALCLTACGEQQMKNQEGPNLDAEVKYILDGEKYVIPLRFHFDSYVKHRQWPGVKERYTKVDAIAFSAVLPSLDSYSEGTREEFEKSGPGKKLHVLIQSNPMRPKPLTEILAQLDRQGRLIPLENDVRGLVHYADSALSDQKEKWVDLYVAPDMKSDFWIRCVRGVPSPTCDVITSDPHGEYLSYSYSRDFLKDWQDINSNLAKLIETFKNPSQKSEI